MHKQLPPRRPLVRLLVLVASLLPASAAAQPPAKPVAAEVRLDDGSTVRVQLGIDAIPIVTKYGRLVVPVVDIRRIEFGLHVPADIADAIARDIKRLGSAVHKERVAAGAGLLAAGHFAAPALRAASRSADPETSGRAAAVLAKMGDNLSAELLALPSHDTIHAADMPIVGRIDLAAIETASPHFGRVALQVGGIRSLRVRHNERVELTVDAASDAWVATNFHIERGDRLIVTAEGVVDLWPAGPGQHVTGPKGYNTTGKGGQFMAGAIIARIGDGKSFAVGERLDVAAGEDGRLYLMIVASPWNQASSGGFRVKLQRGR